MDLSDKAVRHAEFLASAENGEITLLNVLPNSSRSFYADLRRIFVNSETFICRKSQRKKMREVARLFDLPMSRIHTRSCLVTCAMKFWLSVTTKRSDVIVIGPANPGIPTHLLGSNAESILRYAKTPVLVVR